MKNRWPVLLSFLVACGDLVGCSDSKPPAPAATTATATAQPAATATATATASATATAPPRVAPPLTTGQPLAGATCPKQTASLTAWLKQLQAEGPLVPAEPGITLVDANQAPGSLPRAPRMSIDAGRVLVDGAAVATFTQPGFDTKAVAEALAKKMELAKQGGGAPAGPPYVLLELDRAAPWHAVAAAAEAAASAGAIYGTFLFAAPSAAAPPPASEQHTDFHARFGTRPEDAAAVLQPGNAEKPSALDTTYKECPAAAKVAHAPSDDFMKELPKAIAACNCKVDLASVQALAWLAYNRYSGLTRTGLTVNLAKAGDAGAEEVAAAPAAPWSEVSAALRAAAGKGKPVKLSVK